MEKKFTEKQKKILLILIICLTVFVVCILARIAVLDRQKTKLEEELAVKEAESIEMDEKNAALEALLNGENESVLMEQYAHANGYVYPDEYVYINGN